MGSNTNNLKLVLLVWLAWSEPGPARALAWWNDEWTLRKKITLDTSATGSAITDPSDRRGADSAA